MKQLSLPLNLPDLSRDRTGFQQILTALSIDREPAWCDRFGKTIHQWLKENHQIPLKTLSLFSGGGGLDIAFHDCGFDIVQMVELEPKYIQTLTQNSQPGKWLENSQPLCIDIREFYPSPEQKVDFIIGGPPCQSFSAAGRRAAGVAGINDVRGTLFQEYVRLLKTLQPKGFLFENVYGITGAQNGEAWRQIQKAFQAAGYQIYSRVLDAADYGVPQHRERLFIVGLKEGNYLFPYPTHGPDSPGKEPFYTAGEAVAGVELRSLESEIGGRYGYLLKDIPPGLNYSFYTEKMGHPQPVFSWRSKFSDFLYKADPEMPVRTIKAKGGQYTGPFSWENRRFSVAELKRLQTFPDEYELVGTDAVCIEQIGNSVPPQLGRMLALSLLQQVMGIELPFPMEYLPADKQLGFRQRKRQLTKRYEQKAKEAIALLPKKSLTVSSNHGKKGESIRFLSDEFAWSSEAIPNAAKIFVKYELDCDRWRIEAGIEEDWKHEKYAIAIFPTGQNWGLNADRAILTASALDWRVFTGLWKAFEERVREVTGKADLVQLSGYYQYAPQISAKLSFKPEVRVNSFWRVVQCVVSGMGVGKQLQATEMALLWGIEVEEVCDRLQDLRRVGYEVRNHNTNAQIPKGKFLIPYRFPTLTPKSVQLRKNLGGCDRNNALFPSSFADCAADFKIF